MSGYERSIRVAFNKTSGEVIEAGQVFDTKKNAFETRKQFHRNEIELYCCECQQKLNVSTSKFDRLHFKHEPHHNPCRLTDGDLSPRDIDEMNRAFIAKESPRHIELKNKIGQRLADVEGIDKGSIAIDNKVISFNSEKRRPDVYCIYKNKQIVFEIQLSNLSLKYLLGRHEFYKNSGIYLIWILDKFDVHDQSQMARDIKYLTPYENFFKLDETVGYFLLDCRYKLPFLANGNVLMTKWVSKSVLLEQLSFDEKDFEAYFFNYITAKSDKELEQQHVAATILANEQQRQDQKKLDIARQKATEIKNTIKAIKERQWLNYERATELISGLDEFEIEVLNKELNINVKRSGKKPAVNQWITEATRIDHGFIQFILSCSEIELNVNDQDDNGKTALQEIYTNDGLLSKYHLAKYLFKRGYLLTREDEQFLSNIFDKRDDSQLVVFQACTKLQDRSLVDVIYNHQPLLCIIESSQRQSITGFNYKPDEWAAFGNNAIQHYKNYWEYIEIAFKKYGIWDKIIEADRKGTFHKKLRELLLPPQAFDFDPVFVELYPEISL